MCLNDLKHILMGLLIPLGSHLHSHMCGVKPGIHNLPLMKNRQTGRGLIFLSDGSLTSPSSRSSSCPQNTNHNMSESSDTLLTAHKAFGCKSSHVLVHVTTIFVAKQQFSLSWMQKPKNSILRSETT